MNGAYSRRFKTADNQHVAHLKEVYGEERADMLARSKKLQKETNQRRRANAVKRKREAQQEEKRRLEILSKRKEQIREATERFQRLNRHYDPKDYTDDPNPGGAGGEAGAPSLEEALRAIRSSSKSSYRAGSAGGYRRAGPSPGGRGGDSLAGEPRGGSARVRQQHARDTRAELHNRSVHNMNNSRNMFEQQLDQHQQLLIEHQQQSLKQFNDAIHQEMANDRKVQGLEDQQEMEIQRRDSVSSIDSLEAEAGVRVHAPAEDESHANHGDHVNHGNQQSFHLNQPPVFMNAHPASVSGAQLQTSVTSVSNAQAQPSPVTRGNPYTSSAYSPPVSQQQAGYSLSQGGHGYPINPSGSFVVHRSSSSPSVAVVPPSVVQSSVYDVTLPNSQTAHQYSAKPVVTNSNYSELRIEDVGDEQGSRTVEVVPGKADPYGVITTRSNGRYNGQYYQDSVLSYQATTEPFTPGENIYAPGMGYKSGANTWTTPTTQADTDACDNTTTTSYRGKSVSTVPNSSVASAGIVSAPTVNASSLLTSAKPYIAKSTPTATSLSSTYTVGSTTYSTTQVPKSTYGISVVAHSSKPTPVPNSAVTAPNSYHSIQTAASSPANRPKSAGRDQQPAGRTVPVVEEQEDSDSGSDVEEESQPEPAPAPAPKSILKKTPSPGPRAETQPPRVRGGGYARRGLYSRSVKTNASVRDSIEVTREQLSSRNSEAKKPRKKGVRWTDLTYDDDGDSQSGEEAIEEQVFQPAPKPAPQKTTTATPVKRSARPISAKVNTVTPEVDTSVKVTRSASAGTMRRGPFLRPHPPSQPRPTGQSRPTGQPPTGRGAGGKGDSKIPVPSQAAASQAHTSQASRGYDSSAYTTPPATQVNTGNYGNVTNGNHGNSNVSNGNPEVRSSAVYDGNGVRLDRTPTDDEINWLWDKVRTCLNRESSNVSMTTEPQQQHPAGRQSVQASVQRRGNHGNRTAGGTYQNNYMGTGLQIRRKVSMDTLNQYASRRSSLLSQRRQQQPNVGTISYHTTTNENIQPIMSSTAPNPTNTTFTDQDVSESMAAFLTAEMLAQEHGSLSESQIEQAMQAAQQSQQLANASRPSQKIPSALSIEEQRLMQSLERLNEKLKITDPNAHTGAPMVPRPPSQSNYTFGGFKGKVPLSAGSRRPGVNMNGTVSRHPHRVSSANHVRDHTSYGSTLPNSNVRYR